MDGRYNRAPGAYIWAQQGWLYLAVILDLFSRRIVGWSMAPSLERTIGIDALQMAVTTRNLDEGLIHHSDRGSQYASHDYQKILQQKGIVGSMSRRENCRGGGPLRQRPYRKLVCHAET